MAKPTAVAIASTIATAPTKVHLRPRIIELYGKPTSRASILQPTIMRSCSTKPALALFLASSGVVFEQASAAAPWTLPSVASLLLSQFACEHGLLEDGDRLGEGETP